MKIVLAGLVGGVAAAPTISVDLTTIIVVMFTVLGVLVTSGVISTRRTRRLQEAEEAKMQAEARNADGTAILTHAQYEGFIAEAAQRLSAISDAAIARLEAELAKAQQRISELEAELERAKRERNEALAESRIKEIKLQHEIEALRDRIADLERRLEAQGIKPRRSGERRRREDPASGHPKENEP